MHRNFHFINFILIFFFFLNMSISESERLFFFFIPEGFINHRRKLIYIGKFRIYGLLQNQKNIDFSQLQFSWDKKVGQILTDLPLKGNLCQCISVHVSSIDVSLINRDAPAVVCLFVLLHYRLKKKEFSLEEIYTNKNFNKPPER